MKKTLSGVSPKIYYVVSKHNSKIFNSYIKKTLKGDKSKKIAVKNSIVVGDSEEFNSMTRKYNEGVRRIIEKGLNDEDIIIFLHEDVFISDATFEKRLKDAMQSDKSIGIIGIAGSSEYDGSGWWTNKNNSSKTAILLQGNSQKQPDCQFYMPDAGKYFSILNYNSVRQKDDMVVVDGCMMAVRGKLAKEQSWDENLDSYHHYDNKYCLDTLFNTDFTISVINVIITHGSEGELTDGWHKGTLGLLRYIKQKGLSFPLTVQKINEYKETIKHG